jgi:hypothetical protein
MSFIGRLQQKRDELRAQQADTWYVRLEAARGKLGDDGVEHISTQHHPSLRLTAIYSFQTRSRGGTVTFAVTDGLWFYGVGQPGFGRCGICGPARRTPRRAARRTAFSFKSTPSDDLPSRVIRSAQQSVDPRGYSQMMRRAEQRGPQKLPSQVTRRAATARAVLPSGARPRI